MAQKPAYNKFDLSNTVRTSFNIGQIIPIRHTECLPGDDIDYTPSIFARFAPLVAPVMEEFYIETFAFFAPDRLAWPDFDEYLADPEYSAGVPTVVHTQAINEGSLGGYFGLPIGDDGTGINSQEILRCEPFALYALIWNEWFRDQDVQEDDDIGTFPLTVGNNGWVRNDLLDEKPLKINYRHDYFTSARPWPQKGDSVTLPLLENSTATVDFDYSQGAWVAIDPSTGNTLNTQSELLTDAGGQVNANPSAADVAFDPGNSLTVDINSAAATINALREAFAVQRFLELDAVGGTRYAEVVRNNFFVTTPDLRIGRPMFLGKTIQKMTISSVAQTAPGEAGANTDASPMAQLAGNGYALAGGRRYKHFCREHGWFFCLMAVRPNAGYYQGLEKKYTRMDRLEHFWPKLAHIGEQPILKKEIKISTSASQNAATWAYAPQYAEYRFEKNLITGQMATSLNIWHGARELPDDPLLNADFLQVDYVDFQKLFAVNTDDAAGSNVSDQIYAQVHNNFIAGRKIPRYGRALF